MIDEEAIRRHNLRSWGIDVPEPEAKIEIPLDTPTIDVSAEVEPITITRFDNLFKAYTDLAKRHSALLADIDQKFPQYFNPLILSNLYAASGLQNMYIQNASGLQKQGRSPFDTAGVLAGLFGKTL
jgi:hypothetical protein